MGKKDKEKHRKKHKREGEGGAFTVPRPPPWPWPGAGTRSSTGAASSASPSAPGISPPSRPSGTLAGPRLPVNDLGLGDGDEPENNAPNSEPPPSEPPESDDVETEAAEHEAPEHEAPGTEAAGETIDMADIADIAPVVPSDLEERGASPSIPPHAMHGAKPTVEDLTQQIRDLEARLDRMLDERRAGGSTPPPTRSSSASSPDPRAPDLEWNDAAPAAPQPSAHELLSSEFYLRQWGKSGMRQRAEEVDEFGFDPAYEEKLRPFIDFMYRYYFRVDAQGVAQIPREGRCIIVANHAGGPLPYDGLMLRAAVRREHESKRDLRWLTEDFVFYLPFVGAGLNRLGAVRACQENAERLLTRERLVAVFPEGAKGIGKLFGDRYRLQRFGRGGFIRLCLRTNTPIVPCAIVGAEEANPTVYRLESLAKLVGLPYLPVTPTFPALGPVGLLPAPTKWTLRFGSPIRFTTYGPEAADDDLLVSRLAEGVRGVIQDMLSSMLATRRSIWLG